MSKETQAQLIKDYQRELKNAKARIKRLENIGYQFEKSPLPKRPKVITEASIRNLKSKTQRKAMIPKTEFVKDTGEVVKGEKAYYKEKLRKPIPKKPKVESPRERFYKKRKSEEGKSQRQKVDEIYEVLNATLEKIRTWSPETTWTPELTEWKTQDKNRLERMLDAALEKDGREAVAKRLQDNAIPWNAAVDEILYGSGGSREQTQTMRNQIDIDFTTVAAILKGSPLTQEEAIDIANMQENQEVNN